jgi:hypothetical protein
MSLLVHCAVAASDACRRECREYGFPYVGITRVLLANWDAVRELVRLDEADDATHAMVPGAGSKRVVGQLRHYTGPMSVADTLAHVRDKLEGALDASATNALALCSGLGTTQDDVPRLRRGESAARETGHVDAALYEYIALAMQRDGHVRLEASGATSLSQLASKIELWSRVGPLGRPECMRGPGACEMHYHASDGAGVAQRAFPELRGRPLRTNRPNDTAVRPAVELDSAVAVEAAREAASSAAAAAPSAAAALMYDLVVGEVGEADAADLARAVLESDAAWSVGKLYALARRGKLAAELRRMHVTGKVATCLAASLAASV